MSKKSDIELSSIYSGNLYTDLPLTLHFLKSMSPEKKQVEKVEERNEDNIKAVESAIYKSKMYVCYEFYKPISKLIELPKNESDEKNEI